MCIGSSDNYNDHFIFVIFKDVSQNGSTSDEEECVKYMYVFILTVHSAKKFLSLQISQTSQAISTEFNNMLRNQTNARKRKKVINEIFATEKTYQDHLHAVTSVSIH